MAFFYLYNVKQLLTFLILISCLSASAQYTPVLNPIKWKKGKFDTLAIPYSSDTVKPKDDIAPGSRLMMLPNKTVYIWDGTKYKTLGGGGGSLVIDTNNVHLDGAGTLQSPLFVKNAQPVLNVKDFGAIGNGTHDDQPNIQATINAARLFSHNPKIIIPAGRYKINHTLVISGNTDSDTNTDAGLTLEGDGNFTTVLDGSNCSDSVVVRFGENGKNSLGGGLRNLEIIGKPTIDGLSITSHAPYAASYGTFENLYIHNVRDGITADMLAINNTSNFAFSLKNIEVIDYFRNGIYAQGVYFSADHLFITQSQSHYDSFPSNAVNELAIYLHGGGSASFRDCQMQDQVVIDGAYNVFTNCAIETIPKSAPNPLAGNVAIRISGSNNILMGMALSDFSNSVVSFMATVSGSNNTLINWNYINPNNITSHNIAYGVIPGLNSTGVMLSVNTPASFQPDNVTFSENIKGWSFIQCLGGSGIFSKINGLSYSTLALTDSLKVGYYNSKTSSIGIEGSGLDLYVLDSVIAKIKENHADGNNGGVSLWYKENHVFKEGLKLDFTGLTALNKLKISNIPLNTSGSPKMLVYHDADSTIEYATRLDTTSLSNRINALAASTTTLLTGQSEVIGNGVLTTFTIAHGLTGVSSISKVFLTPRTSDAAGYTYITLDATNITVHYTSPPANDASLVFDWQIIK